MPFERVHGAWLVAACFIAIAFAVTPSFAQPSGAPPAVPAGLNQIYPGFVGDWVGQLEYRDFSDNSRVFLPTWLRITQTADGRSLEFAYVYDDGPTKTVKERSIFSLDTAAATAAFTSDRDHSSDTYQVEGLSDFISKGRGTLTLTGTGTENDKKVNVRIKITLRRNLYTYQKETRLPGQEFQFRDGYTFTRRQIPE